MDFDEELKKRTKLVYIPNWFNVDLKTGVQEFFPLKLSECYIFNSSNNIIFKCIPVTNYSLGPRRK